MNTSRNVYLQMKSLAEAREILFRHFPVQKRPESETLTVPDAVGRVLAVPVFARLSSPAFHLAAMDGIAVSAADTFGSSESSPKTLALGAQADYVNTGHVLPPGRDAVIMIENVEVIDGTRVRIDAPVFPWRNVRKIGEDIVATELLFPRNHRISPYCLGAILAAGVFQVAVRCRPRVLIIPTGSELVDWRDPEFSTLQPGQVLETNGHVLGALVEAAGGTFELHPIVGDRHSRIQTALEHAVAHKFDLIMTVGGSSAGSEDFTRPVVEKLGKVLVHGVTMMPGKPLLIGDIQGVPILGMPGYPVSTIMAFEQFAAPLLARMLGQPEERRPQAPVMPTRKIPSRLGLEEFVRVKIGRVGERLVATQLPRGAGSITSLTEADGIIRIPNHSEGVAAHTPVMAELLRPRHFIDHTLVAVGSHDNTLDVLRDELKIHAPDLSLSSSHVGSLGGLMAIKNGVCHLAGSHLLDTEDGTYNGSYIRRYLPDREIVQVNLVLRDQGLIIPKGNPKGIESVADLVRDDLAMINRQLGSGTRILLDYEFKRHQLDPRSIRGYENEEFTHMAVAVAVLSGTVDLGVGIYAAAKALDLDFIPLVQEQYDLIIPAEYFASEDVTLLLDVITSARFQKRILELGGYDTTHTGQVMARFGPPS
ncbi:MAG: molybdopterin biosynthesis protein [Desulfobacterales bacterium]